MRSICAVKTPLPTSMWELTGVAYRAGADPESWPIDAQLDLELRSDDGSVLLLRCLGVMQATLPELRAPTQIAGLSVQDLRGRQLEGISWRLYDAEQDTDLDVLCAALLTSS